MDLSSNKRVYGIPYTIPHPIWDGYAGWDPSILSHSEQPVKKWHPFLNLNSPIQFHIRSYQYTFDLLYESDYSLHGKILSLTLEHAGYVCLQPPIHVKRESEPRRLRE